MRKSDAKVNQKAAAGAVGADAPASEEGLLDLVHSVMHRLRSHQYETLRHGPHRITHLETKVLGYYSREPGKTQSDLVRDSGHDKAQLARLIGALRARGLLAGQASAEDGRRISLQVTPAGQAILKALERQTQQAQARATAGLSDAELRQLLSLMRRVKANLQPEA